jgi:hypothetical protein
MKRKVSKNELSIACFESDVDKGQPQLLHVIRRTSKGYTGAACGKSERARWLWPFQRFIFDNSPLVCNVCHDKIEGELLD